MSSQLSLGKAILLILVSTFLISGSSWGSYLVYKSFYDLRAQDPRYYLEAIVQTGPERQALKTTYLAELLSLSIDLPTNLYQLDLKEAKISLLQSPLIKSANLKRVPPNTLYIDYTIRHPLVYLDDFANTALDDEGVLIPFKPFFSPKKLPQVFLGLDEKHEWGERLEDKRWQLALNILTEFEKTLASQELNCVCVDVSQAFAESCGKRQIVLTLHENEVFTYLLRLNANHYSQGLKRFALLPKDALKARKNNPVIIDMRIDKLSFF